MTLMTSCFGEYGMEEPEVMQDFVVSRGLGFRVEGTPARQEPAQSPLFTTGTHILPTRGIVARV